ncbi:hypothetical protein X975_10084, partial [Stegodyphus mimosarum]
MHLDRRLQDGRFWTYPLIQRCSGLRMLKQKMRASTDVE